MFSSVVVLNPDQKTILEHIYGNTRNPTEWDIIELNACLPLHGKPLLGSLYIKTLYEKLKIFFYRGSDGFFSDEQRSIAEYGIETGLQFLKTRYDSITNPEQRWIQLSDEVPYYLERFFRLYREQEVPARAEYEGVCPLNIFEVRRDPNIAVLNYNWLILAVALFIKGAHQRRWELRLPSGEGGEHGQLAVLHNGRRYKLFFLPDNLLSTSKLQDRFIDSNNCNDVIVIYPHVTEPKNTPRHPGRVFPGTPNILSSNFKEIYIWDLAQKFQTETELLTAMSSYY